MNFHPVGTVVKLLDIDYAKIQYRDWIAERDPMPGELGRILQVFPGPPLVYMLCDVFFERDAAWAIQIAEADVRFEIVTYGTGVNSSQNE